MTGRIAFLNGPMPTMRQVWHSYAIQPVKGTSAEHVVPAKVIETMTELAEVYRTHEQSPYRALRYTVRGGYDGAHFRVRH